MPLSPGTIRIMAHIPLPEERQEKLRIFAEQAGMSPEEFARAGIERLSAQPPTEFREAVKYVLKKNAELYRRLA